LIAYRLGLRRSGLIPGVHPRSERHHRRQQPCASPAAYKSPGSRLPHSAAHGRVCGRHRCHPPPAHGESLCDHPAEATSSAWAPHAADAPRRTRCPRLSGSCMIVCTLYLAASSHDIAPREAASPT
jgi:hypothetical protein